jgi:hypothetical protein
MKSKLLFVPLLFAATGCDTEPALRLDPTRPAAPSKHSLATCEIERAWATPSESPVYTRQDLSVSPSRLLAMRADDFGGEFLRVSDGTYVTPARSETARGLSETWDRVLSTDDEMRLIVKDANSGEVLLRTEPPVPPDGARNCFPITRGALGADGTLVALDCWHRAWGGGLTSRLRVLDEEGTTVSSVDLGATCGDHWQGDPIVLTNEASVVVVGLEGGLAVSFDRRSGEAISSPIAIGEPAMAQSFFPRGAGIVAAALSPDGSELSIAGHDGLLRKLDPRTFEALSDPEPIGLFAANTMTYLPSLESPIAYSKDGRLFAQIDPNGRISLADRTSGSVLATFDAPFEEPKTGADFASKPNIPMSILLEDDAMTVSFEGGVARWGCAESAQGPAAGGTLTVTLDGPSEIAFTDQPRFTIEVSGGDRRVVRQILIDGQPSVASSLSSVIQLWPQSATPGEHVITAIADDGVRTGRASKTVRFLPL